MTTRLLVRGGHFEYKYTVDARPRAKQKYMVWDGWQNTEILPASDRAAIPRPRSEHFSIPDPTPDQAAY